MKPLTVRAWYVPRHVVAQTAGGQGLLTVGAGYQLLRDRLAVEALLGYVSARVLLVVGADPPGVVRRGRLRYALPPRQPGLLRQPAALYYELGTNDLYLVSRWANPQGLKASDVLTLGLGLSLDL